MASLWSGYPGGIYTVYISCWLTIIDPSVYLLLSVGNCICSRLILSHYRDTPRVTTHPIKYLHVSFVVPITSRHVPFVVIRCPYIRSTTSGSLLHWGGLRTSSDRLTVRLIPTIWSVVGVVYGGRLIPTIPCMWRYVRVDLGIMYFDVEGLVDVVWF